MKIDLNMQHYKVTSKYCKNTRAHEHAHTHAHTYTHAHTQALTHTHTHTHARTHTLRILNIQHHNAHNHHTY